MTLLHDVVSTLQLFLDYIKEPAQLHSDPKGATMVWQRKVVKRQPPVCGF